MASALSSCARVFFLAKGAKGTRPNKYLVILLNEWYYSFNIKKTTKIQLCLDKLNNIETPHSFSYQHVRLYYSLLFKCGE